MSLLEECLIGREDTIREAMSRINRGARGIVLVVDAQQRLEHTVTDGDIRRAILAGDGLDQPISSLIARKPSGPITAPCDLPVDQQVRRMQDHGVRQLPLIDARGRVTGMTFLEDLIREPDSSSVQAVIMAGGFGKRLRPLTDQTPKPMLPIRGKPLMERTINRLKSAGIRNINITTCYLPEKISGYFGNGSQLGVDLHYVAEDQPLGTAGALGLLTSNQDTLLVLNGDILTSVDFRSMIEFHRHHNADLTVGVRQYGVEVPFGVVETQQGMVRSLREKPTVDFLVNAGIYLVEPSARSLIPQQRRFDMTELIQAMLHAGRNVMSYPIVEYWIDIGKLDDFQKAQQESQQLRWAS
ncbi:MAG: CBS domain-containing protein [Planctomycetes bacterium]|nr:CBS domain-containing protein [Planctomycetota bacterium]